MYLFWERSGSVVECLTRDREAAGSSLTGLLMGRKESNQTKQTNKQTCTYLYDAHSSTLSYF